MNQGIHYNYCSNCVCNINNSQQYFFYCVDVIGYIRQYYPHDEFYIGVTNDCQRRLNQHSRQKNMHKMFLLCDVNGKDNAEYIEDNLIEYYKHNQLNLNRIDGGSGIQRGRNYVYLLLP